MEFVELLVLTLVVVLIMYKPEKENLAWWLTVGSWAVVAFMYVGHVSARFFGMLNL